MFKISRKVLIISALAVLLVVTGLLNWKYASGAKSEAEKKQEDPETVETANFFSTYRTERTSNREEEMTYLESVITNAGTDTETLNEAQQMKMDIVSNMEMEKKVEGVLLAKGFEDAVVTFGSTSVNVVVKDAELTQAEVAQILDAVVSNTNYSAEDVKVVQAS